MNNKILFIIAGLIFTSALILLFRNDLFRQVPQIQDSDKIDVSASFYPLYFFSKEIGGEQTNVFNLTPQGAEPHDYDPTAREVTQLLERDMVVVNGIGFEPWLDRLEQDLRENNVLIVNASEGIELHEGSEHEHEENEEKAHEEEEMHEEEPVLDPHVWLSPHLAQKQVENILQGFIEADPQNREVYEANANRLIQKLEELDGKFRKGLENCDKRSFVTSHAAFSYLAEEYNLTQVPISGISPEEEPSAQQLAQITDFVRTNNIEYIFFERLVSPDLSQTIANETGARTLVLDPLEGLSQDEKEGQNYFTVMEENLENLQLALGCKS